MKSIRSHFLALAIIAAFIAPMNFARADYFTFWANKNFDRLTYDADDQTNYEDDLGPIDVAKLPAYQQVYDCDYVNASGQRVIPSKRDLQDFTRLWLAGVNELVHALPTNSTLTLSWTSVSGEPAVDLFTAIDPGIGYQTNETMAAAQIDPVQCPYLGRISLTQTVQFTKATWRTNQFIFCGCGYGAGGLTLTIADGNGNTLGTTTTWIQIVDIKQMYERWTVGDTPSRAPYTNTVPAVEGLGKLSDGSGAPATRFTPPQNTNTPYILLVHGWNDPTWAKDRFAETAFKRLYWQGYQGRFGEFRWPTTFHESTGNVVRDDAALVAIYDPGEYQAWQSADGLLNLLKSLHATYGNNVYMLAHSMGNIVAGEALRKAAQQGLGQLVNTYVASQAAVPGHCYDSTLSGSDLMDFGPFGFYGPTTANIYNNWLTTNSAAVGRRVNFYNTNDYALNSVHWQLDEKVKPDSVIGIAPPYGYNGSASDNPPLQNGFYSTYPPYIGPFETVLYLGNAASVSNRYEITAYAAEPRSLALGTLNVGALAINVNLATIWPPDLQNPNQPYSAHFWHSAEFRGDYPQQRGYWIELLGSDAFNLK